MEQYPVKLYLVKIWEIILLKNCKKEPIRNFETHMFQKLIEKTCTKFTGSNKNILFNKVFSMNTL